MTVAFAGCSFSVGTNGSTNSAPTNAAKPANTTANSNAAAPSNSNAGANTAAAPKKDEKLASEKKPEGKSTKVHEVPVPADWIYISNEQRGYGFSVPAGSTGHGDLVDGTDVFMATTPSGVQYN